MATNDGFASVEAVQASVLVIDLFEVACPTCGAGPLQHDRLHYQPEAGIVAITEVDRRLNELSAARADES